MAFTLLKYTNLSIGALQQASSKLRVPITLIR